MTPRAYNAFCKSLPHATHVVQWDGADVWKVGGKVFAIHAPSSWAQHAGITFKTTPMTFEILKDQPGLRPAPYLASRGLKWIQRYNADSMPDSVLMQYIKHSYEMIFTALSKKKRAELSADKN